MRPVDLLEAASLVGKSGTITLRLGLSELTIPVNITNVKQSYGKIRWEVNPINGLGSAWVETVNNVG